MNLLDGWLRTRFLPALPASVLTVLAGRERPAIAWHTAAGWAGLVAEIPLVALDEADALALLHTRGLDDASPAAAAAALDGRRPAEPLADLPAARVRAGRRGRRRPPVRVLDFGPRSVDGRLVEAETEQEHAAEGLSPRETEVLRLVAAGLSNRNVGATLHISERTASQHVSNVLLKLDVRTRTKPHGSPPSAESSAAGPNGLVS